MKKPLRSRRCTHRGSHIVIFNPTEGNKQICVAWCWRCGAIKRSFGLPDGTGTLVYHWLGKPPEWEHPNGVNGTVRGGTGSVISKGSKR
jgi:hypothetical protein